MGFHRLSDDMPAASLAASLSCVLGALEEQLALLDALGARVPAAHVSAAVDHLRLDLLNAQLGGQTRH